MICQICGKVVRDMRKHKLVHSAEKPFQCDRCSYRCSRSGTLKRHMATHLNSDQMKLNNANAGTNDENNLTQESQPQSQPMQIESQNHLELQNALAAQIPIHIPHHDTGTLEEPKYIELTAQQLAQHLPPHSTYNSPTPQPPSTGSNPETGNQQTTTALQTVAYREFKFE